jgi:hemolysin activation/secretion protein
LIITTVIITRLQQSVVKWVALLVSTFVYLKPTAAVAEAPDAGAVLRQEQTLEKFRTLPHDTTQQELLKEPAPGAIPEGEKIFVREFRIEGNPRKIKAGKLQALLAPYVGRELSFAEIQAAALRITEYYNDEGYFLARAVVPRQEVADGVVAILVNEGRLDTKEPVQINGKGLRMNSFCARSFVACSLGGSIHRPSLERGILNLNDNPGITSTAELQPGSDPGTTMIAVDTVEGPLFNGALSTDNGGGRYVGSWRTIGTVNINDPIRYGDQISLTGIAATGEVFRMGRIAYSFPICFSGLRGSVAYTALYFELGKEFMTDPASFGMARNLALSLRYPLIRNAGSALFIGGGYDWKSATNENRGIQTNDKRIDAYNVNLTWQRTDKLFGGAFTQLHLGASQGRLDLSGNGSDLQADQNAGGAHTNGIYRKFIWQAIRIQRITEPLSIQFSADGQFARKNLDGAEKMSLGGPAGVRSYPSGEASGDEGAKLGIDVRYAVFTGTFFGDIVPSLFYDYGCIRQYRDPSLITQMSTPNTYSISGAGVGVDFVSAGKYMFKFCWARAIGSNPGASAEGNNSDGQQSKSRFWMVANLNF